jgi:anthranilate synthase component 1
VEIDSKAGTQSLLLVDACASSAVAAPCGPPLTNWQGCLPRLLEQRLPAIITQTRVADELHLDFPASDRADEDSRLKGSSVLDVLRTLQRELQCQQGEALFMAGSFAYDLIASFEDLPGARGEQRLPRLRGLSADAETTDRLITSSRAPLLACLFGGEG